MGAGAERAPTAREALSVLVPETLRRAAEVLSARGLACIPLKGVLSQQWLYDDPLERLATDVDLLVEPEAVAEACAALVEAGFRLERVSPYLPQVVLEGPYRVVVDLHGHPLSWLHQFSGFGYEAVVAHATLDRDTFGVPLWLPSEVDFFLLLVGKAVVDRLHPMDASPLWEDLSRAPERLSLRPEAVVRRAGEVGLSRALRFVARAMAERAQRERGGWGRWGDRLDARLPWDPLGDLLSRWARGAGPDGRWRQVRFAFLEESVPRGARSLLARVVERYGGSPQGWWGREAVNAAARSCIHPSSGGARGGR